MARSARLQVFSIYQRFNDTWFLVPYLPDVKPFWEKHNIPIIKIHTSGHAYIEELIKYVNAIEPK
jgi:mRNA degradation ribonuclease J1/J2